MSNFPKPYLVLLHRGTWGEAINSDYSLPNSYILAAFYC